MAKIEKILTQEFRVSFPYIFKAQTREDQKPKYSVTMLFPKKTDLKDLKQLVFKAATEKWGAKEKWPKGLIFPFKDGDDKAEYDGYKDTVFCSATSLQKPGLVDKDRQDIINEEDFYAGCYARAQVNAYTYDVKGKKGVSLGLQNVQKLRDGESFSGRQKASEVFESVSDSSDSEESYDDDDMGF